MAILYGTQSNGETLPVQVNETGQLVAQGLRGEKGDQGEPGPPGPVGSVELTSGTFEPYFSSSDTGAGFITYDQQLGYWYRFGPQVTIEISLSTSDVGLTDIRGDLQISGIPEEAYLANPSLTSKYGPFSFGVCKLKNRDALYQPVAVYQRSNHSFALWEGGGGTAQKYLWLDLSGDKQSTNQFRLTFSGLANDSARSMDLALLEDD